MSDSEFYRWLGLVLGLIAIGAIGCHPISYKMGQIAEINRQIELLSTGEKQ